MLSYIARRRLFSTSTRARHENPLGLPLSNAPPQMPRRGPIKKRPIPHVRCVLAVASGKGGVGKSTLAVNLAFALSTLDPRDVVAGHPLRAAGPQDTLRTPRDQLPHRLRVGVLDLDVFGPSVPTLLGLTGAAEPLLTDAGALVPLINHGLPCMSMGFLLPRSENTDPCSSSTDSDMPSNTDTPVVWRGLMVQKAVQQLLFDVDWRDARGAGLDVLVVDMPPGTGDVPLTLAQLVAVDGAVIVSTPQDVALSDVRKGIAMLRKVSVPITGIVLNQASFTCRNCSTEHYPFGRPTTFLHTAARLGLEVLAQLPLVQEVGACSDAGVPYALSEAPDEVWMSEMQWAAERVCAAII
ncbi:P-loop containing nucleoside triphosphate hydrolase protein [Mycena rebaudengoi]|nr:P-loop containing nucleoside triphosphate hydrolase protein [Mycena rebaudengoi]